MIGASLSAPYDASDKTVTATTKAHKAPTNRVMKPG